MIFDGLFFFPEYPKIFQRKTKGKNWTEIQFILFFRCKAKKIKSIIYQNWLFIFRFKVEISSSRNFILRECCLFNVGPENYDEFVIVWLRVSN